jgi:hypothetical protein
MKGAIMNITDEKEIMKEMANILWNLPRAIDALNDEWGKEGNDASFEAALEEVESLMAQGKALAFIVKSAQ